MVRFLILVVWFVFILSPLNAAAKKSDVKQLYWNLGIGRAYGAEDSTIVSNGDTESTSNGTGLLIYTGLYFQPALYNWGISSNIGLHGLKPIFTITGSESFTRKTLDLTFMYTLLKNHRISIGAMHHFDIEYDFDIIFREEVKVQYKDSTSLMLGYDYILNSTLKVLPSIGIRILNMEYERDSGIKEDSPQINFLIGIMF